MIHVKRPPSFGDDAKSATTLPPCREGAGDAAVAVRLNARSGELFVIARTLLARAILAAMLGLAVFATTAVAQTFPTLTGRVVDGADLLDAATEARLTEKLAALEGRSTDQLVVATVPDLQGYAIEEFGVGLGRAWGIGQAGKDNGAILLVSRDDRKVRIEVGYGLEGQLTDALSALIIQNDILPAFRNGDYAGGIEAGVDGILDVLGGKAAELTARAEENTEWQVSDVFETLFIFVFVFAMILSFLLVGLARVFGRKVGRNQWRWLGVTWTITSGGGGSRIGTSSGGGSSSGGFSGGGGSFGGGGSSGSW